MNTAELVGLIATIVTAILIRLIDHYLPNLVDQAHRLNTTHLTRRPAVAPDDPEHELEQGSEDRE